MSLLSREFDLLAIRTKGRVDAIYLEDDELVEKANELLVPPLTADRAMEAAAYLQGVSESRR